MIAMSQLRRYLLPLVILLPLILVCGKLLLTPVEDRSNSNVQEVGWPWVYLKEPTPKLAVVTGGEFSIGPLLADLAISLAVIGIAVVLLFWWHRRTLGRFQFSLRGSFVATLVAGLIAAWFMQV